tara:strand:+ start:167 stop:613 length:447 start_codon:yes stop_codon:yes gene_type:complete
MTELQGGSTAVKNGKKYESRVKRLLDDKGYSYVAHKRINYRDCQGTPNRYYELDLLINNSHIVEIKGQESKGSAKNKLSQAIAVLSFIAAEKGYTPILVYAGKGLINFVHRDPAFNKIRSMFPDVAVMHTSGFSTYINAGKLENTNAY